MARVTGRKTYFEDDGPWVVRGASLVKRLQKGGETLERIPTAQQAISAYS
jgi:hypothetical protein